jgi:hypothetical protein
VRIQFGELTRSSGLAPEWRNYCVYSGLHLPDTALSEEHVIPKSLGGYRSTVIRSSRRLNSLFASTIDARVAHDGMVQFGRRDANARGHSGKKPVARIPEAMAWQPGAPWGQGDTRYTLEIPKHGLPSVYDRKFGKHVPYPSGTGFVIPRWKIDHPARLRFTVKTLLGIGWKVFGGDFLTAVDLDLLRWVLTADFQMTTDSRERATGDVPEKGKLIYVNPFLVPCEQREIHPLTKIERVLVRKHQTTILIRQLDDTLEWSVACLGYLVGCVRVRLRAPLVRGNVRPGAGIRLVLRPDGLHSDLVAPIY